MVDLFRLRVDEGFFLVLRNGRHIEEIDSAISQICTSQRRDGSPKARVSSIECDQKILKHIEQTK